MGQQKTTEHIKRLSAVKQPLYREFELFTITAVC